MSLNLASPLKSQKIIVASGLRRSARSASSAAPKYAPSDFASDTESTHTNLSDATAPPETPLKQPKQRSSEKAGADDGSASDLTPLSDQDSVPPSPGKKKRKKRRAVAEPAAVDEDDDEGSPKKKRKARVKEPEVYVIPDVERRTTTFHGRLGYACLNTVLRNKKPARDAVFCSRTCRIESIKKNGMDWVKDLGRRNAEDLLQLIEWNEANHIKFLRISSELFPFASHPIYGYSLSYAVPALRRAGDRARELGHRLTAHPGQFTQLGSPRKEVRAAAVRELEYHCEVMEGLGVGVDGVLIVHGGGVYGDKEATLARIRHTITEELSPRVRARLVLENDELCYNAEDLLPLCESLLVPLVFDYHHDALYPSSLPPTSIIARANAIFATRGIKPKQHLSEARRGAVTLMERRAHADRCERLPEGLPDDMDLMIEAKDKEQAVLHLYRIYGLQSVNHDSLRPPAPIESTETKGRKSAKRGKKAGKVLEDEDEDGMDEDVRVPVDDEGEVPEAGSEVDSAEREGKKKNGGRKRERKVKEKEEEEEEKEEDETARAVAMAIVEEMNGSVGKAKATRARRGKAKNALMDTV